VGTRCADHVTPLYPQKLALTSPTGGGRSVGIVRVRTKTTEESVTINRLENAPKLRSSCAFASFTTLRFLLNYFIEFVMKRFTVGGYMLIFERSLNWLWSVLVNFRNKQSKLKLFLFTVITHVYMYLYIKGQNSVVGVATRYGLGGLGIESR